MTYRYLLDTNIVSDLVKHPTGKVAQRIAEVGELSICTSIIVASELRFGVEKSSSSRLKQQVDQILELMVVLPLDSPVEFYCPRTLVQNYALSVRDFSCYTGLKGLG